MIDRCTGNGDWKELFPRSAVPHLVYQCSDHRPLLVYIREADCGAIAANNNTGKRFFFEDCWADEEGCKDLVSSVWNGGDNQNLIPNILRLIKDSSIKLGKWNFEQKRQMWDDIYCKKEELRRANNCTVYECGNGFK